MNPPDYYNKDTIDAKLSETNQRIAETHELLVEFKRQYTEDTKEVKRQLIYTNGKVRKHQQILLVVGTATFVIMVMGGSKFIDLAKTLFF